MERVAGVNRGGYRMSILFTCSSVYATIESDAERLLHKLL